jgi:hypothetical protein
MMQMLALRTNAKGIPCRDGSGSYRRSFALAVRFAIFKIHFSVEWQDGVKVQKQSMQSAVDMVE